MKKWITDNRSVIVSLILLLCIVGSILMYSYGMSESVRAAENTDIDKKKADIAETYAQLHAPESGSHIKSRYPDVELVYTDSGQGTLFSEVILPFEYYYSATADKTFGICAIDKSVFICDGKIDYKITPEELLSNGCKVTPNYLIGESLVTEEDEYKSSQ